MNVPAVRKLSGIFFRVKREDKFQSVDFTDMTEEEMHSVLKGEDRNKEWLCSLAVMLGKCVQDIGEQLDLAKE
jgi:hypothetical protein